MQPNLETFDAVRSHALELLRVGHQPTVLIVDDEEAMARFVETILRAAGYHTLVATSGHDAIETAEHVGDFDLLVTDFRMPAMNGDELARQMRRLKPDLNVLYLTGFSDALF